MLVVRDSNWLAHVVVPHRQGMMASNRMLLTCGLLHVNMAPFVVEPMQYLRGEDPLLGGTDCRLES